MLDRIADKLGINKVVLALSVARMGDAIGNSLLFIIIPLYVAKLPAPWFPFDESVRIGLLIALFGVANAILQPIMGMLSDRLGKRKLLIQLGLLIMTFSTLGFVFAGCFRDLVILRILQGVGFALSIPAALAIMTAATEKQTRGGSMGVYTTLRLLGFSIGPLIGGFLYDRYQFDVPFITGAGFIVLGLILVEVWVKEDPPPPPAPRKVRFLDRDVLNSGILGCSVATFIMANDFSMISALENDFMERFGHGAMEFGIAFSALMVSRLLFQIPLGRLSDRVGRKPVIMAGFVLIAPATYLLGVAGSTLEFTGLRLVQGLASAGIAAPIFALAADLSKPGREAQQLSILTVGFGLGISLGPLAAGILAVFFFELPFIVGGVTSLAAAWVVSRFVPETIKRRK